LEVEKDQSSTEIVAAHRGGRTDRKSSLETEELKAGDSR